MTTAVHPKFERVMVIDDNDIDLYITSRLIIKNNLGEKVIEYTSAEEALHYLQANQKNLSALPQLILVDIYMPLMSGFEFMEEYDKLPLDFKKHCKAFIVSSSIDEKDIFRARNDKNVVDFQVKPITKEFFDKIKTN